MPKISNDAELMSVRINLWNHADSKEHPRYELLTDQGWQPVKDIGTARRYAKKHGYRGIQITPV